MLHKFKHEGISGIFMVPTHFHQIFELPAAVLERYRRPPLKTIIANAAPLPQAMKEKIVPYFGEDVLFEIYSSTEAGMVCSLRPKDQLRKLSCVGLPQAHTEVKILDDSGRECAPDEVGELFSRSPYLFHGYWKRPAETAAAFRDGWVSVGDMARRDAEGYLYIVDRKKDMVISGGVNIYPREIEEVLLKHPAGFRRRSDRRARRQVGRAPARLRGGANRRELRRRRHGGVLRRVPGRVQDPARAAPHRRAAPATPTARS